MEILKTIKALQSIGDCKEIDDAVSLIVRQGERIAELEEQQRWIPVAERLPEQNTIVLGNSKYGEMGTVKYDGEYFSWNDEFEDLVDITHWMPLPESPKEDD